MADSTIITNPNQKDTEQVTLKKKGVFGGTAEAFKDGEFLGTNPSKKIDIDEDHDFFDPLEELMPISGEDSEIQDVVNLDDNTLQEPEKKEVTDDSNDFDLSGEFEPIINQEDGLIVNDEVVLPETETVIKDEKTETAVPDEKDNLNSFSENTNIINGENIPEVSIQNIVPETIKEPSIETKEEEGEVGTVPEETEEVNEVSNDLQTLDSTKELDTNQTNNDISDSKKESNETKVEESEEVSKITDDTVVDESKEIEPENTDLKSKFYALLNIAKQVYEMKELKKEDSFDVVGMKTENQEINYSIVLGYNNISFDKKEKKGEQLDTHNLSLAIKNKELGVEVSIDKETLFIEQKDLATDESKLSQVIEKINKFIFLIEQEIKSIEKEKLEKEEKEKKRWLKGIFRNF